MSDQLPSGLEYVRTTDVFDENNHPAGLERAHQVASRVWGRLVVYTGEVIFVFEDDPGNRQIVSSTEPMVIPPGRKHHVEFDCPSTFCIEFYREPEEPLPSAGLESTGLADGQ